MPKVTKSAEEESVNHLEEISIEALKGSFSYPVMVCGVTRKVNIGNFENIDIYAGITVPMTQMPGDQEAFKEAANEAAKLGFEIASKETSNRYNLIKDLQEGESK